ncbi:hypothetical protein PSI22_20225 [Xenorhabdus sp. XENO-7]|uniref:Uridine kinase n=1 Tax=Xenorhabdus aichiensis TaxID=3025874 RepID=A0ABT5M8Q8_9GAMM|nr:hypothetical protein [Xenorhabdus aichiensis]MDC9623897.1 hypothetical protein [Xenorhabdus aichiensis]
MTKIISITSVSGGGKTTISNALVAKLHNSCCIHFDEFEFPISPADIDDWINRGGDYCEWDISPFSQNLNNLVKGNLYDYIVLDYPFARAHPALSSQIDYAFFLETPLDIALSRRVLRDFQKASSQEILDSISEYLKDSRPSFIAMQIREKCFSDYIIDGELSISTITRSILNQVKSSK